MKMNSQLIVLASVVLMSGCSKIVVKPFGGTATAPAAPNGVIYALPKTVVRLQIKVDRTTRKGAPFMAYARIFAPNLEPVCDTADCGPKALEYSVEDGATFSTYGEPDPNQVFVVEFAGGGAIDQSLTMTWNNAGLFSSASSTVTNRTTDIITSSISLAAGIGAKAFLGATEAGPTEKKGSCEEFVPGSGDPTNDTTVFQAIQSPASNLDQTVQEILLLNYCRMKKEDREKLDLTHFKGALGSYAAQVGHLVKQKNSLLMNAGVVFDPTALIGRIETEINAKLIPLFIGTKSTSTWNAMLDSRNVAEDGSGQLPNVVVLRLGPAGVEVVNAEIPPEGTPIPKDFKKPSQQAPKEITVQFTYSPAKSDQLFAKVTDDDHGERSFRYRVPAQVKAILADSEKTYGGATISVAQLGKVLSLSASRHSKSLTYNVGLIEATGALKTFTLGTTGALDAATINSLSSSAGTVLDAKNAADQKAQTAADPATALTKQDTILKLQDDICTIQKKYDLPCTVQP